MLPTTSTYPPYPPGTYAHSAAAFPFALAFLALLAFGCFARTGAGAASSAAAASLESSGRFRDAK